MSKVSVIIATYNSAAYLKEAIDSVLAQEYKNFEIIVVDDGSTDRTKQLVEGLQAHNSQRIQYVYQQNQGPAPARNSGIKHADGRYIAFLDADDIWLPDKLSKQMPCFAQRPQTGFVYCDNIFVDENNRPIENYIRKIKLLEGSILLELFNDFFIITSGIVLKRECIDAIGLFDEKLLVGEDYEFFLRLAKNYQAGVVRERLFRRRVHAQSLSRQDYALDACNDINTLIVFLKNNPAFYQQHRAQVSSRIADYYFDFAYRLLDEGKNFLAFQNLISALRYKRSLRIFKNFLMCCLPYQYRKKIKGNNV